jgi:hypothetical protein
MHPGLLLAFSAATYGIGNDNALYVHYMLLNLVRVL